MTTRSTEQQRPASSAPAAIELRGVHTADRERHAIPRDRAGAVDMTWVLNAVAWLVIFAAGAIWRFRKDTARV